MVMEERWAKRGGRGAGSYLENRSAKAIGGEKQEGAPCAQVWPGKFRSQGARWAVRGFIMAIMLPWMAIVMALVAYFSGSRGGAILAFNQIQFMLETTCKDNRSYVHFEPAVVEGQVKWICEEKEQIAFSLKKILPFHLSYLILHGHKCGQGMKSSPQTLRILVPARLHEGQLILDSWLYDLDDGRVPGVVSCEMHACYHKHLLCTEDSSAYRIGLIFRELSARPIHGENPELRYGKREYQ
ncbi:hypothetical protein AJ80_01046 [Polytolypa hystricis UAMH7299]|uniref:Uncharacterized protein n=1 Tax=Polytolypa hystricis (strain UAMH7299) TaxID=1447883 RepID=A0A2B7YTG5_POLH7|nr:hypothetical protein AJ80_01046 [Polytolypa hystricis UAMH7299]